MKKGFTLVELLCVIIIIAVISMITFPMVTSYINDTKDELYEAQIKDLELAGEKWALANNDKIDKYHINDTVVSLKALQYSGYLEKDEILNPKTKEEMRGFILIKYNLEEKKYTYKYYEEYLEGQENPTINSDLSSSYVMYLYNSLSEDDANEDVIKRLEINSHIPFYLQLVNYYKQHNSLRVVGENIPGLYETNDEYIFKGDTVNNYVKYGDKTWRILSIDKNDYSMKLVSINFDDYNNWSLEETIDFKKSIFFKNESNYLKVLDTWYNGVISNSENTITGLRSNLALEQVNSKEAIISVYDYVAASLSDACDSNFLSGECKNNNYLASMYSGKDVWTMNNDGSRVWYINGAGGLATATSNPSTYNQSKVIKLPVSVYCTNFDAASGSDQNNAFVIE